MSASSDVRAVEELGRDLSRLIGDGTLPPKAGKSLGSLIELAGRLASDNATMSATITAQERQIAELAAQLAALTAQIAQLQRDLYGSRSERNKAGGDGSDGKEGSGARDKRPGGKPGRRKDRGDSVNGTGLRFTGNAPVIDITVTPPEIEGLPEDGYEVISERVHCRVAALDWRHVVIRYRHLKVKIRETGALVGAPARESVFKNSCVDISFVAGMLIEIHPSYCSSSSQSSRFLDLACKALKFNNNPGCLGTAENALFRLYAVRTAVVGLVAPFRSPDPRSDGRGRLPADAIPAGSGPGVAICAPPVVPGRRNRRPPPLAASFTE